MIVLDSSAVVEVLVGSPAARAVLAAEFQAHVPELAEPEVLSTLKREVRIGSMTLARAGQALEDFGRLPLVWHRHGPLGGRAWSLRDRLSAYDAFYVALAEALGAVLVTLDARLARAVAGLIDVDLLERRP